MTELSIYEWNSNRSKLNIFFVFQMNFPGKSIDELVLEEPEENGADENGEEENEEDESDDSDDSEEVQGKYLIVQENKKISDIERSQFQVKKNLH